MSAFRRFDPWAESADQPDGPAKAAKAAKVSLPPEAARALAEARRSGWIANISRFSHFSRPDQPKPGNNGGSGEAPGGPGGVADARDRGRWGAADWHAYYEERVATAAAASRVDRATAERWAYETCVTRWLNANPPPEDPTRCAYSGEALPEDGGDAVPVLRGGGGHVWVRRRHLEAWLAWRRAAAVAALAALGVRAP